MEANFPTSVLICVLLLFQANDGVLCSSSLSVESQWIVDLSRGATVKLACVNWAAHLSPMLAEGLHARPLPDIARTISSWGFNCVILTWATTMFTNKTLAYASVSHTFTSLKLLHALHGISSFNGKLLGLSSVDAFKEVVAALGRANLMVVLDNVADVPGSCHLDDRPDGCWFLEDAVLDADQIWLQGLGIVASTFRGWPNVVAISLRGRRQKSIQDWDSYMHRGFEVIMEHNPELLVIHGVSAMPFSARLEQNTVNEIDMSLFTTVGARTDHRDAAKTWCSNVVQEMMQAVSISSTTTKGPLLVGVDMRAKDGKSFTDCFLKLAAVADVDWAVSPLQGSYYLRGGMHDDDESSALFNHDWTSPRNPSVLQKLQALQHPLIQDMEGHPLHKLLFHPMTGLCATKVKLTMVELGPCEGASRWSLLPQGILALDSTYMVISSQGISKPALLTLQGSRANGPWVISSSTSTGYAQIFTHLFGETLCLDGLLPASLLTNPCICLDTHQPCKGSPASQWFSFMPSTSL